MSTVTVSTKRNRVYPRKFDHELAIARYHEGVPVKRIADEMGVTDGAVWRVVDPRIRKRMSEAMRLRFAALCDDCGGPCTHNWSSKHQRHDRVVCNRCAGIRRREDTLLSRLNDEGDIRCARCEQHQPVTEYRMDAAGFPKGRCRSCETAARRAYRQRTGH